MSRRAGRRCGPGTLRGGVLAACSTALATSAHAAGGGGFPSAGSTLLLTGLIGWVATALAGGVRGPVRLLAVLGVAQLVMHGVLAGLGDHHHAGRPVDGTAMTVAHVAATVLTALLLARAEALLATVRAGLRRLRPHPLPVPPAPAAAVRTPVVCPAGVATVLSVLLHRIHRRRGPPAFS